MCPLQLPGNSFAAGTLVDTGRGSLPIEQVRIGDQVLAWDEASGQRGYRKVIHLIRREQASLVAVTLATGEVIRATAEHPFHVEGTWVPAGELKAGQRLTTRDGKSVAVRAVRVEAQSSATTVYNLSVDTDETYHVGRAGVLVHNARASRCSRDQREFKMSLGAHGYPDHLKPQAHHIVPLLQMERRALKKDKARSALSLLKRVGFDLGNAKHNGVWLPSKSGKPQISACVHKGTHTNRYLDFVADKIVDSLSSLDNPTLADAERVMDELRSGMLNGDEDYAPQRRCHQ